MKKVLACILSTILIICMLTPYATATSPDENNPEPITPEYQRVSNIFAGLSISSAGLASCMGAVTPTYASDTVVLTATLQYLSGSTWHTYSSASSWSKTGSGYQYVSGQTYVTYGHTYRVMVTAACTSSNGSVTETVYAYSPIKTYP